MRARPSLRIEQCLWISTIYPLLQCQSSSGSLVRASDQNSEEPGLNHGWISMSFCTKYRYINIHSILLWNSFFVPLPTTSLNQLIHPFFVVKVDALGISYFEQNTPDLRDSSQPNCRMTSLAAAI